MSGTSARELRPIMIAIAVAMFAPSGSADAKGCHETSDVVGVEHCSSFGEWSRQSDAPRLFLELAYFHRELRSLPVPFGPQQAFLTTDHGFAMRALYGLSPYLYSGIDLLGGVGAPFGNGYTESLVSTHAIIGAHAAVFRVALGAELAGGGRIESFQARATMSKRSDLQTRRELELRGTATLFSTERISFGLVAGHSLIDHGDYTLMISLGGHARARDGM